MVHADPISARGQDLPNASKVVDPVERYTHFAEHYAAGDLDPAFPILTAFELSHAVDVGATTSDLLWMRSTLPNYRPSDVGMAYGWRYVETVHDDVQYGDSRCPTFPGGVCTGSFSDIVVGGDVCGGRAFWGRFSRKGFGLPTWGATEKGHASMASWTPTGWIRQLGSAWPFCWWGERGGADFHLETQVRDNRCEYQKVLRGGWVAKARGEEPVNLRWTAGAGANKANGKGGLWSALMLYRKKLVALAAPSSNRTIPAAVAPIVNKVDALLARSAQPLPPPAPASTGADGTITIPADAFTSKNRTASMHVVRSFDEGVQLQHTGCASPVGPPCPDPPSSSWIYSFTAAAGNYFLTANFSTWHMNQDLLVSVNGASTFSVPVWFNRGWWNQTVPVSVALAAGKNVLTFSRTSTRTLALKQFVLSKTKPVVPPPPGNFTPAPAPPPAPPGGAYIEVPASTNCTAQGISQVADADACAHACYALGFKSSGARNRPNISGCFVMTDGIYSGNCNFNSNKKAECIPPCTLYGSEVRSICVRK